MTLTKAQIIDAIPEELGISRKKSVEVVETLLEIVKRQMENGEDVLISGFGKFCIKEKKSRRGRNPATGSDMMLDQRRVVVFRCSKLLRDKINTG